MTHDDTTLQAAIDAAFQTNGEEKNCGNLVTHNDHYAWSREDSARLAVAKAFLAALQPAEQSAPTSEPETFEHEGKTWTRHTPGDPCPVEGHVLLNVLWRWELQESSIGFSEERADTIEWGKKEDARYAEVIGWRYADESQPEPALPRTPAAGDVVRLKSGGPDITVKSLTSDGLVSCIWFTVNGQYHQLPMPASCLELVRKEKP